MFHIGMPGDLGLPIEHQDISEADVVATMRRHMEGHFPLSCPVCEKGYDTLRDYLLETEQQGDAIPFDAELGNWRPLRQYPGAEFRRDAATPTLAVAKLGEDGNSKTAADTARAAELPARGDLQPSAGGIRVR